MRLAAVLFMTLLMIAPSASAQSQKVVQVSIRDFYFEPSELVIEPGTTVQWVNEGATQHSVFATNPAGRFRSGTLNPGESYTYTFPEQFPNTGPDSSSVIPGTYRYYCEFHPDLMKASVTFGEPQPEATIVQQPPTVPKTGGPSPILLASLLVVVAVGVLSWVIKRRFT